MQKIRIKKTPQPGDQLDYGLVGRNVKFTGEGEASSNVKNTMTATSEDKANIEVEGGETVVGDINKDGFLEHFTFVGKRHSKGGMPVNIPEGSFIFSDTKKLRIKDEELLDSVFGLKPKKGGYTPAEIAKKYQINQYVQDLKSQDTDPIQKRSAAEMLKKNTEKLGMLALVQESLKGFPDGIPAIAESVMAGLQGQQIPGMEQGEGVAHEVMEGQEGPQENEQAEGMKWGGVMGKYPDGGLVNGRPTKGYVLYINNTPVKVKSADVSQTLEFPYRKDYIVLENGQRFTQDQFNKLVKGEQVKITHSSKSDMPDFSSDPVTVYTAKPRIQSRVIQDGSGNKTKLTVTTGDKLTYKGVAYEVVAPYGEYSKDYAGSWKNVRDKFDDTHGIITVKDAKGNITFLEGEDLGDLYNIAPDQVSTTRGTYLNKSVTAPAASQNTQKQNVDAYGNPISKPATTTPAKPASTTPAKPATSTAPRQTTPQQTTVRKAPVNAQGKSDAEIFNSFKEGGAVMDMYQDGATVSGGPGGPQQTQPGTLNTTVATQEQAQAAGNQRIDPNKEIAVGTVTNDKGEVRYLFYKGATKIMKDANGNIIMSGPRTDTQFEQYGSKNINQILANAENVKYTNTNFGSFANQPNVKGTGIYLSSGNANARQSGDLSPEEWQDFKDRHADWIDAQYTGGFAQFQKDLRSGKAQGDKATGWFQDAINEKSMKQFGVPYFTALGQGKKEDNPYYRDSKFGQVTYSVPRFFDAPKTPPKETPGQDVYYYCVELTDGTKSVQSVTVEKGKSPTPPSGGNIKSVTGGGMDKAAAEGNCINATTQTFEKEKKKEGPWWIQDIVNFTGAITDRPNRYEPSQGKIDLVTPGYDLLDPTRKLAANQEQMARYQSQVENTADGNVGLATTLGASGEGFANAANVLDTTEAANIGIVNQAYNTNAQIQNQEIVGNETARQNYVKEMATMNQQYDNARQQDKWREIAAFNNGTTNWFRKKQMEQVLFPQVYVDPILGDVEFSGQGRQIFGDNGTQLAPDVYQNPMYSGSKGASNPGYNPTSVNNMVAKSWQDAYNAYLPTMGEEQAKAMATKAASSQLNAIQSSTNPASMQQQYMNAYNSGMTLPAAFNATPWDDGQ